jgi:phage tail sheath protein FI
MATFVTPGVYYECADAGGGAIAPLRTDIAGFVGIARRGPLHLAVPVESWRQFVASFGDFTGAGFLAYAVRGFFENGGRRCWVVRVASPIAAAASLVDEAVTTIPVTALPWNVQASSSGVWGNDLEVEWHETHRAQTTSDATTSTTEFATVRSVAGFQRGTHVRLVAGASPVAYRVVSAVDADRRRLYWVSPDPAKRLPYDQPFAGSGSSPLFIESIEYTLLVREIGRLTFSCDRLSLVPEHPRYGPDLLAGTAAPEEGVDTNPRPSDQAAPPVVVIERRDQLDITKLLPFAPASLARAALSRGFDGLSALSVSDFIGDPADVFDDIDTRSRKRRGIRALEPIEEVAIVAVPDIQIQPAEAPLKRVPPECKVDVCLPPPPPGPAPLRTPSVGDLPPRFSPDEIFQVQQALIEHCAALHDRFALLDPPFGAVNGTGTGIAPTRAWRQRFDTDIAALYTPWLLVPDPLMLELSGLRAIPPSGHVAGFIAQTDLKTGVHRAPANGPLTWVQGVTLAIDDALHGVLNPEGINAIRAFAGRGLRVFGARTLSSDPDWRFVNVRRLLLMLEKAIRLGLHWATFEPNNRLTRSKIHLALTSLLLEVWRRGAFVGKNAKEAFFVNCGEDQNPASTQDLGMLVAEVGVAATTPFEFIVVRVGMSDNALEISESRSLEMAS